ncbi:MAG: PTS sugar transporter subunit IIA [Planctomycetes bacterium]|nr:PTS sugar transporter subunit IIA [Planctomycetota bacterium]
MSFADMLAGNSILYDLNAASRDDVLGEVLTKIQENGNLVEGTFDEILKKLVEREELGSTGVGNGIAVPHAKHKTVQKPVLCIARSQSGVNFGALDGEPVRLFFMLLSPDKNTTDHLKALTFISTALRDEFFCKFLKNATSKEEMIDTIQEMDEKLQSMKA